MPRIRIGGTPSLSQYEEAEDRVGPHDRNVISLGAKDRHISVDTAERRRSRDRPVPWRKKYLHKAHTAPTQISSRVKLCRGTRRWIEIGSRGFSIRSLHRRL